MNRNFVYRILTVALVAAGALLVWLSWRERGIQEAALTEPPAGVHADEHGSPVARAFGGAEGPAGTQPAVREIGGNLFAPDGAWLDQRGAELKLSDLRGQRIVFTFIYTICDDACPLIVRSMQKGLDGVPEGTREGVRYVLFSFDPETDRPPALAAYAEKMGLHGDRWLLLTAPDETVRRIADLVAFRYQRIGKHFSHNAVIGVADPEGEIVGWFADERITQAEELAQGLTKALSL
jgi:cytochrome oxidase Cu insertion factor (SCO1/SenC/PrrC family)